jgi:hypothetical protein
MNETHYDDPSDLPDNFDPSEEEPVEQEWEDWRDEDAFASAGWGTDESYGYAEDFGYFGEMGLWD